MKTVLSIIGIILIILSLVAFTYQGLTYRKNEKVLEVGSLQVNAEKEKHIPVSPVGSGIMLAAGVICVFLGRKR